MFSLGATVQWQIVKLNKIEKERKNDTADFSG